MPSVSAQVNMDVLQEAFNLGRLPATQRNSNGTHVIVQDGRKIKLIDKFGNVSLEGFFYYKLRNIQVPKDYVYGYIDMKKQF